MCVCKLMENCADSIKVTRSLFQVGKGGAVPTSAHDLQLQVITRNLACECYRKWHYLGDTLFLSSHDIGVFYNGELLGCISFGEPNATDLKGYWNRHTQKGWLEIKRLALSPDCPKNSESRVIAISIRLLKKMLTLKGIVTYADSGVGHVGTIYKASGFKYLGLTAQKSDFWVNGEIQQRGTTKGILGEWKPRSRKHLFIKQYEITFLPTPSRR